MKRKIVEDHEITFETLKSCNNRLYFLCGIVCVVVLLVIVTTLTLARYRTTESIKIVEGQINYKVPDFNMVALYMANGFGEYVEADIIPASGYALNMEQSYCGQSQDGEIIRDDTVSFTYEKGSMTFSNVTKKGTKCYLYFDIYEGPRLLTEAIKDGKSVQIRSDFSTVLTDDTTGIIYSTSDNDGMSYYFAGDTEENWVRFGGYYWRIIRINGDGTIRLIYAGEDSGSVTDANRTGTTTQISLDRNTTAYAFNAESNRSEYVGLKYTQGSQHGNSSNSDILDTMNTWYITNISSADRAHVDTSAWFCSDRNMASGYSWSSIPSSIIRYATYERLGTNKTPTLQCNNASDRLTTLNGIGLITADEVVYAGGMAYGVNNQEYYLCINDSYWTMSPAYFGYTSSFVYYVSSSGGLYNDGVDHSASGIRPVINLKADTTVTGDGTASNPFEVQN